MRIITTKRLEGFWANLEYGDSKRPLLEWIEDVRFAAWQTPADAKGTFGKRVDFVKSRKTGTTLTVFDIAGNKYRLIAEMRSKTNTLPDVFPKTFSELCRLHLPRPINDSVDYENTAQVVDRLATRAKLSADQEEYLETLSILIEKYDRDTLSESADSGPVERLKRLMTHREMSASDLGRVLGNRSLGPAILRGNRAISKANAIKLGAYFKMNPAAFFRL